MRSADSATNCTPSLFGIPLMESATNVIKREAVAGLDVAEDKKRQDRINGSHFKDHYQQEA